MKRILIILLFLGGLQARAQYFQWVYGNANDAENNAQMVPSNDPMGGYVLAGNHLANMAGALQEVHIVRTDNNGNVPGAPFFNNSYLMIDVSLTLPCQVLTTSVTEMLVAPGVYDYIAAGIIFLPGNANYDVFLMRVTAAGAPVWAFRYDFTTPFGFKDPKIQMDIANANVLVTGRCYDYLNTNQGQDVYALSVNAGTGALNWFQTYDLLVGITSCGDDAGIDIVDNPYTAGSCLIVGMSCNDGLLLELNSATGAVIANTTFTLPAPYQRQYLTAIHPSANPMIVNGFIVSGVGTSPGTPPNATQDDAWTMLVDQTGAVTWSTTHDNSFVPNNTNVANNVLERFSVGTGFHEYYTAGTLQLGPGPDMHVLKLNNAGMLLPAGEFTYGVAAGGETGNSICMSNTGGFTASGTNGMNNGDQYLVNSYFNGVNPCNWANGTFTSVTNPPTPGGRTVNLTNSPQTNTLTWSITPVGLNNICFAPAVGGGNNIKLARNTIRNKDEAFNFTVLGSGDLKVASGKDIEVTVNSDSDEPLTARITDVLGREYPCKLQTSDNVHYKLTTGILAAGTYYLVLANGKTTRTQTLLLK